jgi:hypothetical protein
MVTNRKHLVQCPGKNDVVGAGMVVEKKNPAAPQVSNQERYDGKK